MRFLLLFLITLQAFAADKVFRAGAAASNVTPWLGVSMPGGFTDRRATKIHDELHARCLVLDDGKTKLAIVVVDNCILPRDVLDRAKALAQKATAIPAAHILISATHCHSGPAAMDIAMCKADPEYQAFLARRIADGIQRATANLAPAKIGWGFGELPSEVFNRRWHMKKGGINENPFGNKNDTVRMNPPRRSPLLARPAGPTDTQVPVLSVLHADGRPLALLSNYSLHYVGGTGAGTISADYFGVFADRIQQLLKADRQHPPFVGMLSNGTSGDINNINFQGIPKRNKPYEQINFVAHKLADEVLRVQKKIQHHDWLELKAAQKDIPLGVRRPNPDEITFAKTVISKAKNPKRPTVNEVYAQETLNLAKSPPRIPIPLQALHLGDLRICAIPCEPFAEVGLALKDRRKNTFVIGLANGYYGYLPTARQMSLGGYETWRSSWSFLEVDSAKRVIKTLEKLMK
jgi:neutral ceramidase